ncbi:MULTISPECIES: hypothetical protein [Paenibacillus]|uniref:Uncharacterized protein n=1 Tax=Paenibacillus woosongensis TaxID=307580 RepID=A0A7X2YZ25_9BACL|nr:hypothetical protein [Paenibacillus woosongensis]MUG43826.1 hypothetical protein [Paenibacillus woosongensis]
MSKSKRGKALWTLPSRGRGTCPVCRSTRIKLLYARKSGSEQVLKVCKRCFHASQEKIDAAAGALSV